MDLDPQLVELGVRLTDRTPARNTATSVATRVKAAKAAKRDREAVVTLEEIITDLSEDRNELLQIAQAYKEQLVAQTISDADVEYITSELVPKLAEFTAKAAQAQGMDRSTVDELVQALNPLLSVETLTILQLLGFNFKRAIGEPLTDLVARAINTRAPDPAATTDLQRRQMELQLACANLAMDEAAYDRFKSLWS